MKKPHKHAELIKAWADGAEIEYENEPGQWIQTNHPCWSEVDRFRIKPEEKKPVVRWLWTDKDGFISSQMLSEDEARGLDLYNKPLEWSRTEFPD